MGALAAVGGMSGCQGGLRYLRQDAWLMRAACKRGHAHTGTQQCVLLRRCLRGLRLALGLAWRRPGAWRPWAWGFGFPGGDYIMIHNVHLCMANRCAATGQYFVAAACNEVRRRRAPRPSRRESP
jgi:hypothetical protein